MRKLTILFLLMVGSSSADKDLKKTTMTLK